MKPFWEVVRSTPRTPLGEAPLSDDIARIRTLIESRIGRIPGEELRVLIREVLPYHVYCVASGLRDDESAEYAALAIGEDIRKAVKKCHKGKKIG